MGVEGPKEKEKGKKVIRKEGWFFFLGLSLKKRNKVQLHKTSDFRDIKRRRMASDEEGG